ncbi:MAG TPA: sialidase family protein [Micromonosporaceae bacterium]|nr:sialidase family protein [Micromonosporaceae bacterium]
MDRIGASVRQPPLAELYAVAARRRRQRRVGGAAAGLAVALLGVGVATVPAGSGPDRPDPQPPTEIPLTEVFAFGPASAVAVQVTDSGCTVNFAATEDAGRTWSELRPLRYEGYRPPYDDTTCRANIEYRPLNVSSYLATVSNGRSYLSTDRGRTWLDADSAITTVASFPPDARPVSCGDLCIPLGPAVAVSDDGRVYRLKTSPVPGGSLGTVHVTPDGAMWATYHRMAHPPMVARSADGGRTWRTWPLPAGTDAIGVAARDGRTGYALVAPPPDEIGPGGQPAAVRMRLFVTTDGARSWQETPTDLTMQPNPAPFVVGSDGSLLVVDGPGMRVDPDCRVRCDEGLLYVWTSHDGRHFTRGPDQSGHLSGSGPGGIWIFRQDSRGQALRVSADGRTWTELSLPR